MKIGISTSTFFNNTPTEGMFELLRNVRVDTTEMCLNTFSEYEKAFVDSLALSRGSVDVVAVSPLSTQFEPQLFSPNAKVRDDAENLFKKVCYACFALGAKYYTFCGPIDLGNDGVKNMDYGRIARSYNRLADIARAYGVTLSVKNMRWGMAATPEFYNNLMEACPSVCATLDLCNAELSGYELRDFFDAVPPQRISLIEVSDFIKGEWCLPGKGKFNFDRMFAELDKRKIVAPVLISSRSDCYSDFIQVRESYDFLCDMYNQAKD